MMAGLLHTAHRCGRSATASAAAGALCALAARNFQLAALPPVKYAGKTIIIAHSKRFIHGRELPCVLP